MIADVLSLAKNFLMQTKYRNTGVYILFEKELLSVKK